MPTNNGSSANSIDLANEPIPGELESKTPTMEPVVPGATANPVEMSDVDPTQGFMNELKDSYDAQDDIYSTDHTHTLHGHLNFYDTIQQDQYQHQQQAIDQMQPGVLKDAAQGLENVEETVNSPANPVSPSGVIEGAKGVVGGAAEGLFLAPANLIDSAFTQANLSIVSHLTGKSEEELKKENPAVFEHVQRELPDWLQTDTTHGQLLKSVSQFASGFTGIGALGKLSIVADTIAGLGTAAESLPLVGRLMEYGGEALKDAPHIQKVTQTALEAAKDISQTFATDAISFNAQQGNLANMVADLTGPNVPLLGDISKFLAVSKGDSELEGRIKNGFVGQLGQVAGASALGAVKVLKKLGNAQDFLNEVKGTISKGSQDFKTIVKHLKDIDNEAEAFKADYQEIANADPHALLDMLKAKETIDESILSNKKIAPQEPSSVEVITPADSPQEASDKVFRAYASVQEHRMGENASALAEMLKQQTEQGSKAFNKQAFGEAISEKIRSGQPIDIQQEILNHTSQEDLTNIDAYIKNFKDILEATTTNVKRYESNPDLVSRVKSILSHDLGQEAWQQGLSGSKVSSGLDSAFDSLVKRGIKSLTQDEEALLEMMSLKLLSKHLIPSQMSMLGLARFEAKVAGNPSLVTALDAQLQRLAASQKQSEALFDKYLSNAGRRLQAGGQATTELSDGVEFMQKYEEAKKGFPLLSQGGNTLTEAELDALSSAAKDLHNAHGDINNPGQRGIIGKNFYHWMKALDTAGRRVPSYTLGVARELFYNSVLSAIETVKSIAFSNYLLKGTELGAKGLGALVQGDRQAFLRTADEVEGFIRYQSEGVLGGLKVLGTGGKHPLDYTSANPRIISSEGIRNHFGKSIGDLVQMNLFGKIRPGKMADSIIDWTGRVVNFPTAHVIGGVDTAFKVANQRAILWTELKQAARFKGLNEIEARAYAVKHIDDISEDLVVARATKFKSGTPMKQQEFNVRQLDAVNQKLMFNTDKNSMSIPLSGYGSAGQLKVSDEYDWSDRWVFKTFSSLDKFSRQFGMFGTWEMPFIKTFANAVQYGIDQNPLAGWMSPHNQKILLDPVYRGTAAQQELQGQLILGSILAVTGFASAQNGLLSPISGSRGAGRSIQQLTRENQYTLHFPYGKNGAITLNLAKGTPISDGIFIPGKLYQIWNACKDGTVDVGAASYASISLAAESFNSKAFLRGASVSIDSFTNPSYSTADNFYRNVVVGGLGSFIPRATRDVNRFLDPYQRDFNDLASYALGRIPGASQQVSPNYDLLGHPRPADDYVDVTNFNAMSAIRLLTPIGITYTQNDPISKEVGRFGKLGQSLTPPVKNMGIEGGTVPLDQFKNDKGESLWDAYNRELSSYKFKAFDGSGKDLTLREYLNALIKSEDYQKHMTDNQVTKVTGRRAVVLGSRWAELSGAYQEAKDAAKDTISGDPQYSTQYKNANGDTLEKVLDKIDSIKEGAGQ